MQPVSFTLLSTNDLHSQLEGSGPDYYCSIKDSKQYDSMMGHYARLLTLIRSTRSTFFAPSSSLSSPSSSFSSPSENKALMLVDAGDFFSGTLFHTLGPDPTTFSNPELDFFVHAGYDVTTLGNHEFDATETGLKIMLDKFKASSASTFSPSSVSFAPCPSIVTSNIYIDPNSELSPFAPDDFFSPSSSFQTPSIESNQSIQSRPFERFQRSFLKEFSFPNTNFRVGVLGYMGTNAEYGSQKTRTGAHFIGYDDKRDEIQWSNFVALVQQQVDQLKSNQKADVVIVLLHGGHPEDTKLAQQTKGIDVIVSGHMHELYKRPIVVGKTILTQSGSYGHFLGKLDFVFDGQTLKLKDLNQNSYLDVDSRLPPDPDYLKQIELYKTEIDVLLKKRQLDYVYNSQIFTDTKDLEHRFEKFNPLGQFVTQGLMTRLNFLLSNPNNIREASEAKSNDEQKEKEKEQDKNMIQFYFTVISLIRSDFRTFGTAGTSYQFSDIFRTLGIGYDQNLQPGNRVVSFYLTPREVYDLIALFDYGAKSIPDAIPAYPPNVTYRTGWGIPIFNQVKDLKINGLPYKQLPPLVRVATTQFLIQSIATKARNKSFGFIQLIPKDSKGNAIDFDSDALREFPHEYVLMADYLKYQYRA